MPAERFDLRLVAPFVAVAESLQFSRAALDLGVAQPALVRRIGRLERQLGARLVDREGRRVALTPAGERFLVEARVILGHAEQIATALRTSSGVVRIHLGDAALLPDMRAMVAAFVAENPEVEFVVVEGTATGAVEALRRGEVDVAFDMPLGTPQGMSYTVYVRAPFTLVCGPQHRLAQRQKVEWSELADEPVFLAPRGISDAWNATVRAAFARAGVVVREVVGPNVANARYLVPMVARGDASLVVAEWVYPTLSPGLVQIPLTPEQEIEKGAVWDARTAGAVVRSFVARVRSSSAVEAGPVGGEGYAEPGR